MQRIYLADTVFTQELSITDGELYHQITRVMRARVGQSYVFFDGKNPMDYVYTIRDITKDTVFLDLKEKREKNSEVSPRLSLYQASPNKLSKLEYIIQKCCEVGYTRICFYRADHSQPLALSEKKIQRLNKIAIEATEQCGGNIIPEIIFSDELVFQKEALNIVCHTDPVESLALGDLELDTHREVNIFVGPEGGFSSTEIKEFQKHDAVKINFGNRILRCETVGEVLGFYISQGKK